MAWRPEQAVGARGRSLVWTSSVDLGVSPASDARLSEAGGMPPTTRSAFLGLLVASLMLALTTVSSPAGAWNVGTEVVTSVVR